MGNKKKVNELMYELQNSINSAYVWRELGDDDEVTKISNRITEIRQEILHLVTD
jgi:ABC-type iron transport system FetAB ATPase subunit